MLSSGAIVIIWDEMLSSGIKCYHLELMLSSRTKFYHLGLNAIIWDAMLLSGANVIIWCYHVMLSSGMITPLFFIFPGNFTHSSLICICSEWIQCWSSCRGLIVFRLGQNFKQFMYSQKRFSQESLLISTKYFKNRIIMFCLELWYSAEK